MSEVTVIGGGVAGLTAAITAAQAGVRVRLLESRAVLGGRARTAPGPYCANLGPHALYSNGASWRWLEQEGLLPPTVPRGDEPLHYVRRGQPVQVTGLRAALATILAGDPPIERSFRDWAPPLIGPEATELLIGLASIPTLDYDPGRLSAAFTHERLRRSVQPGVVQYVVGGWGQLVARLAARATELDVAIELRRPVRQLPAARLVVATSPAAAQKLLGVRAGTGSRVGLMDLALPSSVQIPSSALDLDQRIYLARYTAWDHSLAPAGEELIQISCPRRPGEDARVVQSRIERLLDELASGWRQQVRWSRHSLLANATGALDLPGRDWRGRPAIGQREGVFLAGDWVAAPGLLSEVSFASGQEAGLAAATYVSASTKAIGATS